MASEGPRVTLNFIVDKAKPKVLFAEAGSDFVDILFSFLTLPLGTIVRLLGKNGESQSIGSLNALYDSVANLEIEHFATETCKDMLLNPRNSSEVYCQKLTVNVDDTEPTKYFLCEDNHNYYYEISTFQNVKCRCGKLMNHLVDIEGLMRAEGRAGSTEAGVYVRETTSFIITDDLHVMPNSLDASVTLLNQLGYPDANVLQEMSLSFGLDKISELLKWSLVTNTPLTNVVLGDTRISPSPARFEGSILSLPKMDSYKTTRFCPEMSVKVVVQKSKKKVLYVQVEEDFINFLFCFLAIPLGRVEYHLGGNSSLESINNIYISILNLDSGRYLKSESHRKMLLCPKLAQFFLCSNQILPFDEAIDPNFDSLYEDCDVYEGHRCVTTLYNKKAFRKGTLQRLSYLDPKKPNMGSDGFVRSSATFLVTDDFVVTPLTYGSMISELRKLNAPLSDIEFQVMSIDSQKALAILRASLGSTSVFTDCLGLFLKKPKDEPV